MRLPTGREQNCISIEIITAGHGHVKRPIFTLLDLLDQGVELEVDPLSQRDLQQSVDKLLMTQVEQAVGHAALTIGGPDAHLGGDDTALKVYLYSRAQSVMGGTSQVQRNLVARRILGMPA